MVKNIIKYPEKTKLEFNAPVRFFNDEIKNLIIDLKDTIEANELKGLSGYQINNPYSVVVIKQINGNFIEFINPRIIKASGKITTTEKTTYFNDIEAKITRDKNITIMYEDIKGNPCYFEASDEEAVLIQRKIDYTFGANFFQRLSAEQKETLEQILSSGKNTLINDSCPTSFKRDKILKVVNISIFVTLLLSIFDILETYLIYSFFSIFALIVTYFFYAQYENKSFSGCSSCQLGNIIGTTFFHLLKLGVTYAIFKFM